VRLSVLDVGSNTVHLLVVDAHRGGHPTPMSSELSIGVDTELAKINVEMLDANGLRQLISFISRMTTADRAELEGVSAERAPQIVAGALVAEASMRALSRETVDICPWALREGLVLRKLGSEADGTALVETSARAAGNPRVDRAAVDRSRGDTP
jgi:exopolyphosphatase/pppGpp-phosphohydrolase